MKKEFDFDRTIAEVEELTYREGVLEELVESLRVLNDAGKEIFTFELRDVMVKAQENLLYVTTGVLQAGRPKIETGPVAAAPCRFN